jgi:hypothetical protein
MLEGPFNGLGGGLWVRNLLPMGRGKGLHYLPGRTS